jgi:predicted PurR-regulated permease PerM
VLGWDGKAARYVWTAGCIVFLVWLVYNIRDTLFVFIVALLFAYLLWPLVDFLDRRMPGRSRLPALALVYLALIGVLSVVGIVVGSHLVADANALAARLPDVIARFHGAPPAAAGPKTNALLSAVERQLANHSQELVALLPKAALGLVERSKSLVFIVLVPVLSFFFLKDGREIYDAFIACLAEGAHRNTAESLARDLHVLLAQYMRALVIQGGVAAVCYGIAFALIGVPYAVLLATMTFFLEFIPMVGPFVGGVVVALVAIVSGTDHLLLIFLFIIVFRAFQDYLVSPHLMSTGMQLHPLLVIFGVLAGASVAGVPGSFLSVPILATLRIVYRAWLARTHREMTI